MARLEPVRWMGNGVRIIDQTLLPRELVYEDIVTVEAMFEAIVRLKVRGAPLIGISAAYGVCCALVSSAPCAGGSEMLRAVERAADTLAASRPTAVNLFWALDRLRSRARRSYEQGDEGGALRDAVIREAISIHQEDLETGRSIGMHGLEELAAYTTLLTHCNAGGLATGGIGTALAPVYAGIETGKLFAVYADETRPLLQGSRITAFELQRAGCPVTVICDNMASAVMASRKVDAVIVGADRIAANGDTANKIGTFGLAVNAQYHGIPFYVAAPFSTFDPGLESGSLIPIEERGGDEIGNSFGRRTAPEGVSFFNPAFDVTPHELITAIITERGVFKPPYCFSREGKKDG